jgi:hypothetical protein
VKLTLIARVTDGLPLAEGLETDKDQDLEYYKQQAKVGPTHLVFTRGFAWVSAGTLRPAGRMYRNARRC